MAFTSRELESLSVAQMLTWVRCLPFIQVTLTGETGSYCTNLAAPTVTCRWRERGRESQAEEAVSGREDSTGLKRIPSFGWKE